LTPQLALGTIAAMLGEIQQLILRHPRIAQYMRARKKQIPASLNRQHFHKPFPVSLQILLLVCVTTSGRLNALASPPSVTVSGTTPVVLSWPTNFPSFALQTKTNVSPTVAWEDCSLKPAIIGTNYVVTNTFTESSVFFRVSNWPLLSCCDNLKKVGLSMRTRAVDYNDRFPFQVGTNSGGTRELRALGPDGFDTNSFLHFMVLSNYGAVASRLVCPGDIARSAATNFGSLGPEHVTYQLRTGDAVTPEHPGEVLAVCPVDGNTLYCDGSVNPWTQLSCLGNLKHIGLSMRIWALDNDGSFPFHVHTNWGGTMELRALGPDGFDTNSYVHFVVLSNQLAFTSRLVCPADTVRQAATNFASLSPENVTYRLRTGDMVTESHPEEVLAVCPVEGNTLYCDGSVTNGIGNKRLTR
jgi:hypothetical protein